jgi:penicillin-binding protein 2
LETDSIDENYTAHCPGGATFYGHYYKCWEKRGHGGLSLHNGIVHSCDVYFYNVGIKTGVDNIAQYAEALGIGHKSGVDLPQEKDGIMPSTKWVLRNYRRKWYAGEVISVAIGQGAVTVTPLQLVRAYAGWVTGGHVPTPHLLKSLTAKSKSQEVKLDPEHVKAVISGTCGVVNEGGGTGGRARLPGVEVCGKTGTAQVASNEYIKKAAKSKDLEDNAWFIGFAPGGAPEIVCVALVEHGGHSTVAVPIVRDVIKAYFDKKARTTPVPQSAKPVQFPAPVRPEAPAPPPEPKPKPEGDSPTPF